MGNISSYDVLIEKLNSFIKKYYLNQLLKGGIYFIAIGLALFLSVSILEYIGKFNSTIRTILFYSSSLLILATFAAYILIPLAKLFQIGKQISHEQAAGIIGQHFSEVSDKLNNVLQLKQNLGGSEALIEASINQKSNELKPIPFVAAINLGENKKFLKYALPPLVALMAILFFSPNILSESTNRLVSHRVEFIPEAPFTFVIENENLSAIKFEDFPLVVEIEGEEVPNEIKVQFRDREVLMKKQSERRFEYVFKNLQSSFNFNLQALDFSSPNFELKVLPKPKISFFNIEVELPKYLKRSPISISNTGDLNLPEGSKVKWVLNTEDAEEVFLKLNDSIIETNRIGENKFSLEEYLFNSQFYKIFIKNSAVDITDSVQYTIKTIKDKRPEIELDVSRDSNNLNQLYFNGIVKDDYGFSRLEFHYQLIRANGEKELKQVQQLSINYNLSITDYYHQLNTSNFNLKSGDQLNYYFTVWDNDGVNGSKPASTAKLNFTVPSQKELSEKENQSNEKIKDELKDNIELAKDIREDLERLKEKMIDKKKVGFQEKKMLESILKKQKKIQSSLKKLNEKNKEKSELQKEYTDVDEEILEKQKQLEELFEKVMTEEMKEMLDEIEKMMEELKKEDIQKALEKMELNNEELEKELDRNLELFKQLELEKELADTKKQLDELKQKQDDLKEKTEDKKGDKEDLQKEQESLKEEFEEVEKKIEQIKEKNDELESPNEMPSTESLEEQIKEDMKESAEELGKKNNKKSSESQEDASEKMQEMSDQLSDLQMQMQSSANAENLEDLRFLLENLIQLSFDQEDLMESLKETNVNDPQYFVHAKQQKKLKDDAKIIEDSLFALSKRVIQLQSIVNKEMSAVNFNMQKAIAQLAERKTAIANSRQQFAMTSINNLALLLDEAMQQMQSQMNLKSNGSCSKPGQGSPKPGAGNSMSKLQQQLNQQLEDLKKSLEKGSSPKGEKPGSNPGNSGKGGMSKQLAKTAAKQAAIREALGKLQEQLNQEGNKEGMGGLKKLGELMEETETDLVNKRITNETILRQQEILTRLLESEKAQREREKEEKRESIEYSGEIERNPNEFLEYNRKKMKEVELLRTLPPTFNQFYKQKVSDYFKNL